MPIAPAVTIYKPSTYARQDIAPTFDTWHRHCHINSTMVDLRINIDTPISRPSRLNVLLTQDRPHAPEHWTNQLPRFLKPQGITAYVAKSGREAIDLAAKIDIHAAVVDLATPMVSLDATDSTSSSYPTSGDTWLLELFQRLPVRPPLVVIRSPAYSQKQVERLLREALRLGVFSVIDKPVHIEQLLAVFRRLLDRQYRGEWPGGSVRGGPVN